MENKIDNKHNTFKTSATISLVILFLNIFLTLILFKSNFMVYANAELENLEIDFLSIVYNHDIKKERLSQGPKLITVKRGNQIYKLFSTKTDILSVLKENRIFLEENDILVMNTEYIVNGTIVSIIKTENVYSTNYIDIPFEREYVRTNKYRIGEENVVQKGVLGVKVEKVIHYYEDGILVRSLVIEEQIKSNPIKEIVEVGTFYYSLEGITIRGHDCPYWYSIVDSGPYTEEEKEWLKFIMYCESGCNAESNKSSYKGLFQWSPYWWRKQFTENIFDGHAQIKHTITKYRAGESTRANQWPGCHSKYLREIKNN